MRMQHSRRVIPCEPIVEWRFHDVQIGMSRFYASVDDDDRHVGSDRLGPSIIQVNVIVMPLIVKERIVASGVRRKGWRRRGGVGRIAKPVHCSGVSRRIVCRCTISNGVAEFTARNPKSASTTRGCHHSITRACALIHSVKMITRTWITSKAVHHRGIRIHLDVQIEGGGQRTKTFV